MTMRNKKKVTRTFQVDCAQYLRDLVGTFLPFTSLPLTVLPIPDVPALTRPVLSPMITALVHVTMIDTPGNARMFPCVMGENRALVSARCCEERLGEWFGGMLEVRLP